MGVTTTQTNKPFNPRGNDQSPKGYNRAALYSGKALDFDGVNDYVQCDNLDTLYSSDFTISYFFKWESTGDNWGTTQGSAGTNLALLTGKDGSGVIRFAFWGNDLDAPASLTPAQNEWSFLSFTYNRTTKERKIYINGILSAEDVSASNPNPTANNFQIGAFTAIGGYYNNQVSNAKVFNTALTAAQVADLYNNPEKVVPTGVDNTALKLWLPMMEGAGTTAYDGSGNGNHGTISGATYAHGIGAPVAQTAVIDWNKGVNLTHYSEDGTQWSTDKIITITQDQPDPFGGTRAQRLTMDASSTYSQAYKRHISITGSTQYTAKMWLKAVSGTPTIGINFNQGTWHQVTLTNEWAEYEVTRTMNSDYSFSHNIMIGAPAPGTSSTADFYIFGLQIQLGDTAGPYTPTIGTPQTSEVLLPQGLTTGRDITGVNLFENVRKQGALNLDGNSWAEVHDNESLDITPAMTMECWVDFSEIDSTAIRHFIVKPSGATWATPYARYTLRASNASVQWWFESAGYLETYSIALTGWNHFAVTKDGTAEILYINGAQVDTATNNATITASAENLLLGQATTGTEPLDSPIAQPRIYNRALTAEEVQRNFDASKNTYTNS